MTTKSHSVIGFALFGILSLIVFQGCGNYQAANTTGSGDFSNDSLFLTSLNQDGLVCPSNAMGITCGEEQVLTEISNDFGCNYMACANTSAAPLAALSPAEQVTCPDTLTPSCSSNQTVRVTVDRFGCEIKTCANDDGTDNPIEAMQQSLQTDDFKAPLGHKTALITDATGTRQALVPRFCGGMTYDDYLADSQICQGLGEKLQYQIVIPSAPGLYGKTFSTFSRDVQNAKNAAEILQLTDRICIQFDGTCTDSSQRSPWSNQNASIGPNRLTREAQSCGDSPYNARSSRPSIAGSGKNQCVKLPLAWGGAACTIEYRADNEERSLISKTIPNGARFSYADRPAVKHGPSGTDLDITTADRSEYRRAWCKRSGIQERIGGTCADGTLVFDDPGFTGTLHAYCNDSVAQRIASEEDRRRRENGCELKWNDHIEANGGSKLLKDGAQVFYNNRTSATFTEYCDGTRTRVGTPVESIAGDAWSSVPLCEKAGIRCEMGVLIQSGAGVTCEYNIMEPGDTCDENTVLTNHK